MKIVQLHEDNKIKETFTLDKIYSDDTIDVIKKKIIEVLSSRIAYEELYLFAKKRKLMSKRQVYNELSQNTNVIPRTRLRNFLSNIVSHNIIEPPSEDTTIDIVLTVEAVLQESAGASRFSLLPAQQLPYNAFVSLATFQQRLNLEERVASRRNPVSRPARVNTILIGGDQRPNPSTVKPAVRAILISVTVEPTIVIPGSACVPRFAAMVCVDSPSAMETLRSPYRM